MNILCLIYCLAQHGLHPLMLETNINISSAPSIFFIAHSGIVGDERSVVDLNA